MFVKKASLHYQHLCNNFTSICHHLLLSEQCCTPASPSNTRRRGISDSESSLQSSGTIM